MYLREILHLLSLPILIVVSYWLIRYFLRKFEKNLENSPEDQVDNIQ